MPQIQIDQQPVTQITVIEAEPQRQAEALSLMKKRAHLMRRQPVSFRSACIAGRAPIARVSQGMEPVRTLADDIDPRLYEVAEVIGDKMNADAP